MPTLEKTWNWIADRDAKVVFALAILAFAGMTVWRGWIELSAGTSREASGTERDRPARDAPETPPFEPLGLLAFVTNQAAQTVTVPVNPFRPTAEEIFARIVEEQNAQEPPDSPDEASDSTDATGETDRSPDAARGNGQGSGRNDAAKDGQRKPWPKRIVYRGVFRRTDGVTAAWVEDAKTGRRLFYPVGETIHGITVAEADMKSLTLKLDTGAETLLPMGQPMTLPEGEE